MKRFRFSLRPVAVLRAHRESRAKEIFAAAVRALTKTEEELAATRQRIAQFEAALFAGRRECFSAAQEANTLTAYRRERVVETQAERAVAAARAAMQQRRVEYLEAHRKLEVVHRLEAKARAAHQLAVNREEQAAFDEFAGRQASRRSALSSP
jgi:flagellar FliJ protein